MPADGSEHDAPLFPDDPPVPPVVINLNPSRRYIWGVIFGWANIAYAAAAVPLGLYPHENLPLKIVLLLPIALGGYLIITRKPLALVYLGLLFLWEFVHSFFSLPTTITTWIDGDWQYVVRLGFVGCNTLYFWRRRREFYWKLKADYSESSDTPMLSKVPRTGPGIFRDE
jgi:hypothetical protein